ncbi:glycosyltransferase family 2 protein [Chiayiivirga flava]|uniref:GT2 family glycosyltransferase n=1 Tax=Chiayiivirga flava TaxID=659595 RepID=A0A7W8G284_9GAMM|nr:glycosyltransferase family 2 protein [Chiayiivirga flava]MBB5208430.1 GT2 family glycosyltransferase [Chiayiivirga flava]
MSPAARPFVVASIVNWNTPQRTLACVAALQASSYRRHRIVVVDNASRDDSVAAIGKAHPDVTVLCAGSNLGFAGGHRLALEQARGWGADALWLVNSDAIVEPDALAALVAAFAQHGSAIYGGMPLSRRDDDATLFDFPAKYLDPHGRPTPFLRDADVVFDATWRHRAPMRVGAVAGSTLLLPLDLVQRHGWLDESWFLHCEEIDYCYTLRAHGVPSYLVPGARVWHEGGGSDAGRSAVADVVQYYRARNEIALARRHGRMFSASAIALKKMLRAAWLARADPARARFVLRGAWHGWRGVTGRTVLPDDHL